MNAGPEYMEMSVEDYFKLEYAREERFEYIDGYTHIREGGGLDHSAISVNVTRAIWSCLQNSLCLVYASNLRVCLSKTRYLYPYGTVGCDKRDQRKDKESLEYPLFVVEVFSPTGETSFRETQSFYYQECPSIQEYLVVNVDKYEVKAYRRVENEWIRHIYEADDTKIELTSIGVTLSMTDIYKNVFDDDDEDSSA